MGAIRNILLTGVGTALKTKDGIQNAISDIKDISLTGPAKEYLFKQIKRGKEELPRLIVAEFKDFLSRIAVHEELQKALEGLTLELEAKIKIGRKSTLKIHKRS